MDGYPRNQCRLFHDQYTCSVLNHSSLLDVVDYNEAPWPHSDMIWACACITARTVFREPVTISNYCKFIFSANVFPKKDIEHSHGFNRRLLILFFNETIPPEEQDPHLADEIIKEELSGIFNWMLKGLERIVLNKKFSITPEVQQGINYFHKQNLSQQ